MAKPTITPQDFEKIGHDDRGVRFVVINTHGVDGVHRDGDVFIAVLPGTKHWRPGSCMHHSWIDHPVTWKTEP